jgi:putative DNA primase/helicase
MRLIQGVGEAVKAAYRASVEAGHPNRLVIYKGRSYYVFGKERLTVLTAESQQAREEMAKAAKFTKKKEVQEKPSASARLLFPDDEPWPEPVDAGTLLSRIADTLRGYVVMEQVDYVAVSLYILMTYLTPILPICPLLILNSAVKRSGKTTLLGVLSRLIYRALPTNNISGAALYRAIQAWSPSLLIDEVDAVLAHRTDQAEMLRGLLNAGHARHSSKIIRCETDSHEPVCFDCFGPKVLAGIGNVPDTLEDRAIMVTMRRKTSDARVKRFSAFENQDEFDRLRSQLARWARDNCDALSLIGTTEIPELDDRAVDNWAPLLAIAELAGGSWSEAALKSAKELSARRRADGDRKIELLKDVKEVFEAQNSVNELGTADLLRHLCEKEEAPWKGYYFQRGESLDAPGLARLLRPFGIHSQNCRQGTKVVKVYRRDAFRDVWRRYLPPAAAPMGPSTQKDRSPSHSVSVAMSRSPTCREDEGWDAKT